MLLIFKPLFSYKKYLLANKIITESSKCHATVTGIEYDDGTLVDMHGRGYLLHIGKYFFKSNKNITPERFSEALDILKENNHIELYPHRDTYQVTYRCTISGERAVNDGFYLKIVYKRIAAIIAGAITVGTTLGVWILKK